MYEAESQIVGFYIVDLVDNNISALFMHLDHDKKAKGKQLHDIMVNWYFTQKEDTVWLGTAPGTRAETFYRKAGWIEVGTHGKSEIKFEMSYENWKAPASL